MLTHGELTGNKIIGRIIHYLQKRNTDNTTEHACGGSGGGPGVCVPVEPILNLQQNQETIDRVKLFGILYFATRFTLRFLVSLPSHNPTSYDTRYMLQTTNNEQRTLCYLETLYRPIGSFLNNGVSVFSAFIQMFTVLFERFVSVPFLSLCTHENLMMDNLHQADPNDVEIRFHQNAACYLCCHTSPCCRLDQVSEK